MADITRESAIEARTLYDNYNLFIGSPVGQKLTEKMAAIEQTAADKALKGATPENTNTFFESRGAVAAIFQLKQLFKDIKKENDDAVKWMQENAIATASEDAK